ncbi:hypothetical protein CPB84DRAFT_1799626 [Gymnopilus junonius]|uniref:Uncharacterized protein n=1 Tax=Gymnopilus junonius TaxID=109634 RepID=A0A9P5NA54_GYMJU|nr:hypothetical protein CPB84DRAFT_1799626 [Gymnopilus junonius]
MVVVVDGVDGRKVFGLIFSCLFSSECDIYIVGGASFLFLRFLMFFFMNIVVLHVYVRSWGGRQMPLQQRRTILQFQL